MTDDVVLASKAWGYFLLKPTSQGEFRVVSDADELAALRLVSEKGRDYLV